jgi:hypothetical protein
LSSPCRGRRWPESQALQGPSVPGYNRHRWTDGLRFKTSRSREASCRALHHPFEIQKSQNCRPRPLSSFSFHALDSEMLNLEAEPSSSAGQPRASDVIGVYSLELRVHRLRLNSADRSVRAADPTYNTTEIEAPLSRILPKRMVRIKERISDQDLVDMIRAVDFVLLPYLRGSNSGFSMLVLSCGQRLLCSALPMFRELQNRLGPPLGPHLRSPRKESFGGIRGCTLPSSARRSGSGRNFTLGGIPR